MPARQSVQWCSVSTAIAASKAASSNGSASAARLDGGAALRRPLGDHHRRRLDRRHLAVRRLVAAGPRADVDDPRASPSASQITAAIRGSVARVWE